MKVETIVNSIFEGLMPSALYGAPNQYLMGLGIDPDVPLTDNENDIKIGGGIRPVLYTKFSASEIDSYPIAIINTPQSDLTWVILANGKVIAYKDTLTSQSAYLIGQVAGNNAGGAFYLNNYIYITGTGTNKDDVSRIGPLNTLQFELDTSPFSIGEIITGQVSGATGVIVGLNVEVTHSASPSPSHSTSASASPSGSASPSASASPSTGLIGDESLVLAQMSGLFLDDEIILSSGGGSATVKRPFGALIENGIWAGTILGNQARLGNFPYPKTLLNIPYLSHFGFAHTDGAGYFLDFKEGRGFIHKIQTQKGQYQGSANDGSAYGSVGDLSLQADYIPTIACSMGNDIVISGTPSSDREVNQGNAMLFFWDAAEELFYHKVPLDDPLCTALWYVGGTLYGLSGDINGSYRLWKYLGGDAVETIKMIEDGSLPLQGASTMVGRRLVWAADTVLPQVSSGLYAFGSKSELFPQGLHHIALSEFV